MSNHYEHKHLVDVTDQAINEFGAGFCTECGEVINQDKEVAIDNSLIKGLQTTSKEINELEHVIQEKISVAVGELQTRLQTLRDKDQQMRQAIKDAMANTGIKKFDNEFLSITYVAPTTRKGFDSTRFKKEQPDIYSKYEKLSDVSASVRITVKLPKGDK